MTGIQTLDIDIPPTMWMSANRVISNVHARTRAVDRLHDLARIYAQAAHLQPIEEPITIVWTIRYQKGTGRADPPNAYPTTKAVLDSIVRSRDYPMGVLADDDHRHVPHQSYERGPNMPTKLYGVRLTMIPDTPVDRAAHALGVEPSTLTYALTLAEAGGEQS